MTDDPRLLIVVGRATSPTVFLSSVRQHMPDNFSIIAQTPLEREKGIDGKQRFICFISGEDVGDSTFEALAVRLQDAEFGASVQANPDDAYAYARENYEGFETEEEELTEAQRELAEKFPPFSAEELEAIMLTDLLISTNRFRLFRIRINDEPGIVFALVIEGGVDRNGLPQLNVKPIAVICAGEAWDTLATQIEWPMHLFGGGES